MPVYLQPSNPLRPVSEYANDFANLGLKQQELQQRNLMQQYAQEDRQRSLQEQDQVRNALSQLGPNAKPQDAINALSAIGTKTSIGVAKAIADTAHVGAQAQQSGAAALHSMAQTGQIDRQAMLDDVSRASAEVIAQPTLENARQSVIAIAAKYRQDPTPDLAQLQQIGDNPEAIRQWAQGHSLTADQMRQQLNDQQSFGLKQQELGLKGANEVMTPDQSGGFVPNEPLISARERVGASSATKINLPISLSTEKKYGEQFAGEVAKSDMALKDAAAKAPELANRAIRIKQILNTGNAITGLGADFRLQSSKALAVLGVESSGNSAADTETLATQLAANTLDMIKASGLGGGTGFSNADRDFLQMAVGGKINLEAKTLSRLADMSHRAALLSAEKWNKRAKQIPPSAIEGTGIDTSPTQVPSMPQETRNVPNVNAKGWVLHTDAQGNKAYVSPDGKQFEEVK